MKFVGEFIARSAGAGSLRTAPLDHEVVDDAMKFQAVVEALVYELLEIGHGIGHFVVVQLHADFAAIGIEFSDFHRIGPWGNGKRRERTLVLAVRNLVNAR